MAFPLLAIIPLFGKIKWITGIFSFFKGKKTGSDSGGTSPMLIIGLVGTMIAGGFGLKYYYDGKMEDANQKITNVQNRNNALTEQNYKVIEAAKSAEEQTTRLKKEIREMGEVTKRINTELKLINVKYSDILKESKQLGLADGKISPSLMNTLNNLSIAK